MLTLPCCASVATEYLTQQGHVCRVKQACQRASLAARQRQHARRWSPRRAARRPRGPPTARRPSAERAAQAPQLLRRASRQTRRSTLALPQTLTPGLRLRPAGLSANVAGQTGHLLQQPMQRSRRPALLLQRAHMLRRPGRLPAAAAEGAGDGAHPLAWQ